MSASEKDRGERPSRQGWRRKKSFKWQIAGCPERESGGRRLGVAAGGEGFGDFRREEEKGDLRLRFRILELRVQRFETAILNIGGYDFIILRLQFLVVNTCLSFPGENEIVPTHSRDTPVTPCSRTRGANRRKAMVRRSVASTDPSMLVNEIRKREQRQKQLGDEAN
ncbi:hypothetical protein ACFX1T_026627 [Malus domestica]